MHFVPLPFGLLPTGQLIVPAAVVTKPPIVAAVSAKRSPWSVTFGVT